MELNGLHTLSVTRTTAYILILFSLQYKCSGQMHKSVLRYRSRFYRFITCKSCFKLNEAVCVKYS